MEISTQLRRHAVFLAICCLLAASAHADLYRAEAAYQKKDFATAIKLFHEIAELGHPLAQETLAIMYVQGEGVARNNVMGLAWAQLAKENGLGANVQPIIDQLESRMSAASREIIAGVHAKFGRAALQKRLLPVKQGETVSSSDGCRMKRTRSVDAYFPPEAIEKDVSGSVFVMASIQPDGRARNPRILYGMPPTAFDAPGRKIVLVTEYSPAIENGKPVPCQLRTWVQFSLVKPWENKQLTSQLERLKAGVEGADPLSQLQYGMLMTGWRELNPEREDFNPLFLKAAQAGLATAQYVIGANALVGIGFERDSAKALAWLNLAADAGQQDAQILLANELVRGEMLPQDLARARELLEKNAASGNPDAAYYLVDLLLGDVDPKRRDPARALELLKKVFPYREADPTAFELRAAAQSQLGEFDSALFAQKAAIGIARKLGWDVTPLTARLEHYRGKQAWTERLLVF